MMHDTKQDSLERIDALLVGLKIDVLIAYQEPIRCADAIRKIEVMQQEVSRMKVMENSQFRAEITPIRACCVCSKSSKDGTIKIDEKEGK